jgi:hypothetical protein
LAEAIRIYPSRDLEPYCRVSERAQVANGSLDRQKRLLECELPKFGRRVYPTVACREHGQLSAHRRGLKRAIELARERRAIVVARDVSRLVRAEAFDHCDNWHAQATAEEIGQLLEWTGPIPMATVVDPELTAAQVHDLATLAGMNGKKRGNKSAIAADPKLAMSILESFEWDEDTSLSKIAFRFGVTRRQVQRFIDWWKQYAFPTSAYRLTPEYRRVAEEELKRYVDRLNSFNS